MTTDSGEPKLLRQIEMITTGSPYVINSPAAIFIDTKGPSIEDIVALQTSIIKVPETRARFLAALLQCVEFSRAHPSFLTPEQLEVLLSNITRCIPYNHLMRSLPTPADRTAFSSVVSNFIVSVSQTWKVSASKTALSILFADVSIGLDQKTADTLEAISPLCEIGWNVTSIALSLQGPAGIEARKAALGWVMQLLSRQDRSYAAISAGMLQRAYGFNLLQ